MTETESSTTIEDDASYVDIHYIKTPGFREVACDGALGGSTRHGKLWLAFFSERNPLPRVMRQKLKPSSDPEGLATFDLSSPATVVESRRGVVRSVEFGVYMSLETATDLHNWLGEYIAEAKKQVEE